MQDNAAQETVRLMTGRLEGLSVPDLFWSQCRAHATGVLHLTAKGINKKVYFQDGRIIFAASSDPNDRLGEMLLREGMIRLDHLEQAISRLHEGKRLGTLLVEAGHLSPEALVRGVIAQVRGIVHSLFGWEEGEYAFVPGPLPTSEVVTLEMKTGQLLIEGIRSVRSFARIRRSVGPARTRYQLAGDWRVTIESLSLGDGEQQLVRRLEGAGESIDKLCREVFLSNFEVYQTLWAFKVLGVVHECEAAPDVQPAFGVEGRLGRNGLAELLIRLGRASETGVLYVTRGALERTFHLREGRCVFATSNNIDDGLVSYLLRRGVISVRDREETARRLLSNKRVGTILLEMGVIDRPDLERMVREHLCEILFDTFRWDEGEWLFAAGELPTIEEIVLDRTLEDLVFAGVRRIASWPRVREGCGGLGARLELTPEYLAVLDRVSISSEDWDLISAMRTPRTPLDLCRELPHGDFRICQTLWALRILDAVTEAPVENLVDAALDTMAVSAIAEPEATPADPEPIAPAALAESEAFELTSVDDLPAAPVEGDTIAPSEWNATTAHRHAPSWQNEVGQPGLVVSEAPDGELISEPWRLVTDEVRPPAPPEPSPPPAPVEPTEPPAALGQAIDGAPTESEPTAEPVANIDPAEADVPAAASASALAPSEFEMGTPGEGVVAPFEMAHHDVPDVGFEMERLGGGSEHPLRDEEKPPPVDPAAVEALFAEPPALEQAPAPGFTDQTMRIPREHLDAIFEAPVEAPPPVEEPAPAAAEPQPPAWDPPADLDPAIAKFNTRHKAVWRVIRTEVGAGATNFVRSCARVMPGGDQTALLAAPLQPDGAFDPAGLRQALVAHRVGDPAAELAHLIDQEIAMLRLQIGEKRTQALIDQLAGL